MALIRTYSVIIPTRDRPHKLIRAIRSALEQTLPPLEVVVVNDNAANKGIRQLILDEFPGHRIKMLTGLGEGAGPARNIGVEASSGEFVAFLDDDDIWLPDKVQRQFPCFSSDGSGLEVCYTRVKVQFSGFFEIQPSRLMESDERIQDFLFLNHGLVLTSSLMMSRSLALEFPFPSGLHEDWITLLRMAKEGIRFLGVSEACTIWDQQRDGLPTLRCRSSVERLLVHLDGPAQAAARANLLLPALLSDGDRLGALRELVRASVGKQFGKSKLRQSWGALWRRRAGRRSSLGRLALPGVTREVCQGIDDPVVFHPGRPDSSLLVATVSVLRKVIRSHPHTIYCATPRWFVAQSLVARLIGGSWRTVYFLNSPWVDSKQEFFLSTSVSQGDLFVLPEAELALQCRYHWDVTTAVEIPKEFERSKRPSILVLTRDYPYPLDTGAKIRIGEILKLLKSEFSITLVSSEAVTVERLENAHTVCDHILQATKVAKQTRWWHKLFPREVEFFRNAGSREVLQRELGRGEHDLFFCDHLHSAENFSRPSHVPTVLSTHNVESLLLKRWSEGLPYGTARLRTWWDSLLMTLYESRTLDKFDLCLAVSPRDRTELKKIAPRARVETVLSGVDEQYFQPREIEADFQELCFVGTMQWHPNHDAARFFLNEIWPRLTVDFPQLRCTFVGGRPREELKRLASADSRIELTGYVQDIREFIHRATVYIVPLRVGSGVRLKILQALACGKAIVSTPLGAEGLPVTHNQNILLSSQADEFALSVKRLLSSGSERQRIGHNAHKLVLDQLTWNHRGESLRCLLSELL